MLSSFAGFPSLITSVGPSVSHRTALPGMARTGHSLRHPEGIPTSSRRVIVEDISGEGSAACWGRVGATSSSLGGHP